MSGTANDLADSTDWLDTPLSGLAPLESGLRCQVCKDFFTTPMITSCSHTFCSLCIRRYLSQEGRCPACRESDQEIKLRRNWALEEMVAHFAQARTSMLAFARQPPPQPESHPSERPKKRRKFDATQNLPERRSTRSQSKRAANALSQASQEELGSTQGEVADSEEEGSVFEPKSQERPPTGNREPDDGLVGCPCCHRRMKEASINAHLDRCIQGLPTSPSPPVTQPVTNGSTATTTISYAQRTKSPLLSVKQERLPTINYALNSDAALRKKLKELGIPSHGSKELMRKRHTEWMNLWNANCDSLHPKAKSSLLKELDTWERTLGRQLERGVTSATSGVMVKDFDRDSWAKSQKDEFDDLIRKAREKRMAGSEILKQEEDPKPAGDGDVLMVNGNDDVGEVLVEPLVEKLADKHVTQWELASASEGLNPLREEEGEPGTGTLTTSHVDNPPGTPQRPVIEHEQIDLTSSPAQPLEHQTPGKQRSRFFA